MRRLVFIESNTTGTGMLALRRADELGYRPSFVTRAPQRHPELAGLPHDLLVAETNAPAGLATAIAVQWPDGIAGVTTTSEFYLPATARVAADLGLPGNPPHVVSTGRDKAAVRRALARAGVGQPRFAEVRSPDEVDAAVARLGLPCIVKPVDGSGSEGVRLCADADEARRCVAGALTRTENVRGQPAPRSVLLEQYVTGPEYSVETFSDAGAVTCVGVTAKTLGEPPWFVETRHIHPAPLPAAVTGELAGAVERALKALGYERGPAHTEVRWTADGPAVIEINARLAGGMIPELVRLATGVDLLTQQLRVALGERAELTPRRAAVAGIAFLTAPERGVLRAVTGAGRARAVPGVHDVRVAPAPGARVGPPTDAYGRCGHVIAAGDSAAAVEQTLDRALTEIAWKVEPE